MVGLRVSVIAAIVLSTAGSTTQPNTPVSDLRARVERKLGAAPADCGQFFITRLMRPSASRGELGKAIACVTDHAARRDPAWFVVQLQGIDSWVARGLMVGRDGIVKHFSYDSDPSGGSSIEPGFTDETCRTPRVWDRDDRKEPTIDCEARRD